MANFQLTALLPEPEFAIPVTLKEEESSCPDLILYYLETWQNCYPQDLISHMLQSLKKLFQHLLESNADMFSGS